jgi:lipopolysaccharide export system protein LptA
MIINRIDPEFKFASVFNTKNGHYVRSNVKGTGEDAFMSSFPELLDIGIMGRCNNAHFCLDENTSILMGDRRSKKIKDIIVGDEVLSLGKTSIITDKVVRTISSESTEQFEINIST